MNRYVLVVVMIFLFCVTSINENIHVYANEQTIEATGTYVVGDGPNENIYVAKERARQEALRSAVEQAGIYVESYSKIENSVLTHDEVRVVSGQIIKIIEDDIKPEIFDNKVKYVCNIKAVISTDNVDIKAIMKDRKAVEENIRLQREIDLLQKEVLNLKESYKVTSNLQQKQDITRKISDNENMFKESLVEIPVYSQKNNEWSKKIDTSNIYYDSVNNIIEIYTYSYNNDITNRFKYRFYIMTNQVAMIEAQYKYSGQEYRSFKFSDDIRYISVNSSEEIIQKKIYSYLGIKCANINKQSDFRYVYTANDGLQYYWDVNNIKNINGYTLIHGFCVKEKSLLSTTHSSDILLDLNNNRIGYYEDGYCALYDLSKIPKDRYPKIGEMPNYLVRFIPVFWDVKNYMNNKSF